jgi:hypothetical protein
MCFSRQRDRVDDAVVIEFVADDRGLVGYERRQDCHHGSRLPER